ncbi:delta(12)-acyl-lipid-desaturase-like [Rhodamnia argentea]|uniref:Delta(12)-acyl-lipid-desaturase-like n=1 Tax=Rhodamnia argentea TaxID=178133 RepID=A0A8B8NXT5_9MYRT|nr:delta(12)-acyl-lipid-desaturase-like [Rhodamnia argentea]
MCVNIKSKSVVGAADSDNKGMSALRSDLHHVPREKPPFTLGDLKRAIPPHCFRHSLLRPMARRLAAWPSYFFLQGCLLIGVRVIAPECGHGAFGDHRLVNDAVGFLLHMALLVPYFSRKDSHCRHHANTSSLDRDEVFAPCPKEKVRWYYRWFNNPPARVFTIVAVLLADWPFYVSVNASGRLYDRFASHFNSFCEIFSDGERVHVPVSDLAVMVATYASPTTSRRKGYYG